VRAIHQRVAEEEEPGLRPVPITASAGDRARDLEVRRRARRLCTRMVQDLLARSGTVSPVVSKLLLLLAERDRLVLLPAIDTAYQARLMDNANVVRAELTTAVALPEDRVAALRDGLATVTGRQVQLETRVNPSIIGGAVALIGSTVYDGSITTQLQRIKERLAGESQTQ